MLEHLGPQLARDATYLVERPADGLPRLVELLALRRCALGDRVELQECAGQKLADLVVQVTRDPDAFGLLGGQHAATALTALSLEPVEHAVEGGEDATDLVAAGDGQALTRPQ